MCKKRVISCLLLFAMLSFSGCGGDTENSSSQIADDSSGQISEVLSESASESVDEGSDNEPSEEVSEMTAINKLERVSLPEGASLITNRTYSNPGKMGDNDGPAVCVYAPEGYNKGTLDIALSDVRINTVRESDGKHVNGYIFIGIDVLSGPGGYWVNCFDTGLVYDGADGKWRLFHNIYANTDSNEAKWYTSKKTLDDTHDYRIEVDSSAENEKCTVNIYDLTDGGKLADTRTFTVKDLKCDGSNTAYYQNFALDYPDNVKVDAEGNVGTTYDNADWVKSTLHSTDENIFMQNIRIIDAKLYKDETEKQWDEGVLGLWPDSSINDIDYACTTVVSGDDYYKYRIDLDMNRQ